MCSLKYDSLMVEIVDPVSKSADVFLPFTIITTSVGSPKRPGGTLTSLTLGILSFCKPMIVPLP
jgi:hypothetical protein